MAKEINIHQTLREITQTYLQQIDGLKKEVSALQIELEKKENELARAKLQIGKLESSLKSEISGH